MSHFIYKSPLGLLDLTFTDKGVKSAYLLPEGTQAEVSDPFNLEGPGKEIYAQLDAYFADPPTALSLPLDLADETEFEQSVINGLVKIPMGEVMTYAALAESTGHPGAYRAVGTAVGNNPLLILAPCHRVVGSDGKLHGFSAEGGLATKAWLLQHEGVELKDGKVQLEKSAPKKKEASCPDYGGFKSGYIAIAGKPNAGKSSLLNQLMGQPIAGVSSKPQTTRKRQLGILTSDKYQIIFIDTPGIHKNADRLSKYINSEASSALEEVDLIVFLADVSNPPEEADQILAELIHARAAKTPLLLAFNKADVSASKTNAKAYADLVKPVSSLFVSAKTGQGIQDFLTKIAELLPEGPKYYPEDQITEDFERNIAAEMIRAAAMPKFQDELPYSLAVQVDEYKERTNGVIYVHANIFVERDAQRGMVIGKAGSVIKEISTDARKALEAMAGTKVFLALDVKVQKGWKDDEAFLRSLGLAKAKD